MSQLKAEIHHAEHENAHEYSRHGAVLYQPVKDKENKVEDGDLDDIPHMCVDEAPARENGEELKALESDAADTCCHHKHEYTHIERYQYGNKPLFEESLKVILLCLKARVKAVAREEEEYTYKENAAF